MSRLVETMGRQSGWVPDAHRVPESSIAFGALMTTLGEMRDGGEIDDAAYRLQTDSVREIAGMVAKETGTLSPVVDVSKYLNGLNGAS